MSRLRNGTLLLAHTAVAFASLAAVVLFPELLSDPVRPEGATALAAWVAEHPADFVAASSLSDDALDSDLPRRLEIWRAAHDHAKELAPLRGNATAGFVRAGLFHWTELGPEDRGAVLEAARVLLQDPRQFHQMLVPLWQLTRDFAYLRSAAPRHVGSLEQLRDVAVANGLFDHYRELREEVRRVRLEEFARRRSSAAVSELLSLVPTNPDRGDEPFLRGLLEELARRSPDEEELTARAAVLAQYAVDHGLRPLEGLAPLAREGRVTGELRERLAAALAGNAVVRHREPERWQGLCGRDEICSRASAVMRGPLVLRLTTVQSDEIPPYVEIYVDGGLIAEGPVRDSKDFEVIDGAELHRVEVRVVNRMTRAGIQRRVRMS